MEKRISERIRGILLTKLTPHLAIRKHKLKGKEEILNSDPRNTQTHLVPSFIDIHKFKNYKEQKFSDSDTEDKNIAKRLIRQIITLLF